MAQNKVQQSPMHQAIGFLARRDHSVYELTQKLLKKGHESSVVEDVMSELQQRGYLDDQRYANMMVRHHYLKGQGPQKIRYILTQNYVDNDIVAQAFSDFEEDWFTLAVEVRQKRFGEGYKSNDKNDRYKEKSKQIRFLMTRGFESDQIQHAIEQVQKEAC